MSGIYGTVKPANISIENDVDIFYSYRVDRNYNSGHTFKKLPTSNMFRAVDEDGTTTIDGLYNIRLPLSVFGSKGIYTIYIKPKEVSLPIYAVSTLQEYPDVRGVIFQTDNLRSHMITDGSLVGYRIQYGDNGDENFTRIITSSNLCRIIPTAGQNKFTLYDRNSGSSNAKLIFCTVTPSAANSFSPNNLPSIGEAGTIVKLANTKFSPIMFEIEMVEHDVETISYMLEGDQVRNLENGTFTVYNDNHEIYKQYEAYTVKTRLGKPLYDVKLNKSNVDVSQNYNNIIESED